MLQLRFCKSNTIDPYFPPRNREGCGSEQIPVGAQLEPLNDLERFLSMLRFNSREKLDHLDIKFDPFCIDGGMIVYFFYW